MEDVSLDLEAINASKNIALSDLHRPPQKHQKINHLTPVTIVLIKTWLGKYRFKKNRILLDNGSSRSIILEKFVRKLHMQNDTTNHRLDYERRKLSNIQKVKNHIQSKRSFWK